MTPNYTPNFTPITFINVLRPRVGPDDWLSTHFARGERIVGKFHDKNVHSDISAIWHGIPEEVRDNLVKLGRWQRARGGQVEVFTVSHHGNPFQPGDMTMAVRPRTRSYIEFAQSALRWVTFAGFNPCVWIGNGSKQKQGVDNRRATISLADYHQGQVTIGSEALGISNGVWDQELLQACPLLCTARYLQRVDPDSNLVVPDGCEVHLILKNIQINTNIPDFIASARSRNFIIGSGELSNDEYVQEEIA